MCKEAGMRCRVDQTWTEVWTKPSPSSPHPSVNMEDVDKHDNHQHGKRNEPVVTPDGSPEPIRCCRWFSVVIQKGSKCKKRTCEGGMGMHGRLSTVSNDTKTPFSPIQSDTVVLGDSGSTDGCVCRKVHPTTVFTFRMTKL
jgi:hypothetical protein